MDRFPGGKYDSYDDDETEEPKQESSKLRAPIPLSEILGRSNAGSGNFLANLGLPKSEKKFDNPEDEDEDDEEENGLFSSFGKSSKTPRSARLGGLGLGSLSATRGRNEQAQNQSETVGDNQQAYAELDSSDVSGHVEQQQTNVQEDASYEQPSSSNATEYEDSVQAIESGDAIGETVSAEAVEVTPDDHTSETQPDDDEDDQTAASTSSSSSTGQNSSTTSSGSSGGGSGNLPPPSPTPNPNIYPPVPPVPPNPGPNRNIYPPTPPTPSPNSLNPNSGNTTVIERTSYKGAVGAFVAAEITSRYRDRKIKREFREADKKLGKKIEKLADKQLSQAEAQATLNEHQKAEISRLDRRVGSVETKPASITNLKEVQNKAEIITNLDIDQRAEARAEVHSTMPSVETLVKAENTYEHLIQERYQQEVGQENGPTINSFEALDNENQRTNSSTPDILVPPPITFGSGSGQDPVVSPVQPQISQSPVQQPSPARVEPPAKSQYTQPIALGALAAVVVLVVVIMAYTLAR